MKFAVKKVGQPLEVVDLPDKYETFKDAVGGYIEAVYLNRGVVLWCNEEGKLIGLETNFIIPDTMTSIEGDVIFSADDGEGGNKDLIPEQIEYIRELLNKKATAYQKYIDTFFAEKNLETEVWTFTFDTKEGGTIFNIDTKSMIAYLRNIPSEYEQKQVRKMLAYQDFCNADINVWLKHIAEQVCKKNLE